MTDRINHSQGKPLSATVPELPVIDMCISARDSQWTAEVTFHAHF